MGPMKINDDHKLEGAPFMPDNMGGELFPEFLVIHYTVTYSGPATARSLQDESQRASVHLVCEKDGSFIQQVPFNRVAWHAGKSEWDGRKSCSLFSIGIEVVNIGPLVLKDEKYWDVYGKVYQGEVVEAKHKNGRCPYDHWAAYPEEQMQALLDVGRLLVERYDLKDVIGHDDVAPFRKIDPGPAFPMEDFRNAVMGPKEWKEAQDG